MKFWKEMVLPHFHEQVEVETQKHESHKNICEQNLQITSVANKL